MMASPVEKMRGGRWLSRQALTDVDAATVHWSLLGETALCGFSALHPQLEDSFQSLELLRR